MTIPFVLSWSLLEVMAIGCPIVASNTAPVVEVIKDGKNGLLADFFSPDKIAKHVVTLLNNPALRKQYTVNARETIIQKYSTNKILPLYEELITNIANGDLHAAKQLAPPKII